MTTYQVRAKHWKGRYWELHIDGVGVTQAHGLSEAEAMARDYIRLMLDVPADTVDVEITPDIGNGMDDAVRAARRDVRAAEDAQRRAAGQVRTVARQLLQKGLTGRDIAAVLRVSPQRVSQLLKG